MKYVIYGSAPTFHITTLKNYTSYVMDARKVVDLCECKDYNEAYQAAIYNGWKEDEIVPTPY